MGQVLFTVTWIFFVCQLMNYALKHNPHIRNISLSSTALWLIHIKTLRPLRLCALCVKVTCLLQVDG